MARRFGIGCWRCWSNPGPQARRRDGPALTKHGDVIVCATTACLRARLRTAPIRSRERQRADAQLLMTFCLEPNIRSYLQLAWADALRRHDATDHTVIAVALYAPVRVHCRRGESASWIGEIGVIGQVESLTQELQLHPLLESEGAGDALTHRENTRAEQDISAGAPQPCRGDGSECGPIEIWGIGVVAAQDLDLRVDLVRRLRLAGGPDHRA